MSIASSSFAEFSIAEGRKVRDIAFVTGISASMSVGNALPENNNVFSLTGVSATATTGSPTLLFDMNFNITGAPIATTSAGRLNAFIWNGVDVGTPQVWQEVDTAPPS